MVLNKTLMILGAGASQARIIQLAKSMGMHVVAIDRNKDAPGFPFADASEVVDIIDKENSLRVAKKYKIDGILPSGDISLPTAAYVAKELGLVCLTPEQTDMVINKELYVKAFSKNHIPYPKSGVTDSVEGCHKLLDDIGFPAIIKPTLSFGGSRGVKRVNERSGVEDAFIFAQRSSKNGRVLVEEFLDGEEHTVESIILNGTNHVMAISDKERIKESYCVATSLNYPSRLPEKTINKIKDIAQMAANSIKLDNWITHMEMITCNGDVKLIDFGARGGGAGYIPAMIVPNVCGINMMEEFIRIVVGEAPKDIHVKFKKGVVYRFFTHPPGKIVDIKGCDDVMAQEGLMDFRLNVKKGDIIPPLTNQLERLGYFVVNGESLNEALRKAKEIENKIQIITAS